MPDSLQLGIGIVFDSATLQQLNALVSYVKKLQEKFDEMGDPLKKPKAATVDFNAEINKMNAGVAKLVSRVENVGKSTTETFEKTKNQLFQVTKNADGVVTGLKKINKFGQDITQILSHNIEKMISWGLGAAALYGTFRLMSKALQTMADAESELVNIRKVLPDYIDFKPLVEGAKIISQQYGVAITDTMKAMQAWSRQIKDTRSIIELTNASMLIASVTDITLESSYKSLSSIIAQFNLRISESNHIVSAWNELSNNMRTTAEDLAQGIEKVGAAARLLGVDFDRTNAMVATMVEVIGTTGSQAGTVLNRMFARIHTDSAIDQLQKLNIDAFQPVSKTLDELGMKWDTLSQLEQEAVAKSLGGMHHWQKLVALFSNYNRVIQATIMSYDSFGSAEREVNLALSTYNKKVEQLNAAWQSINVSVGNVVLPIMNTLIDGFRILISVADGLIPKLIALAAVGWGVYAVIKAISTASSITSFGWVGIAAGIIAITSAILGLNIASNQIENFRDKLSLLEQETVNAKQQANYIEYLGTAYQNLGNKLESLDKSTIQYKDTLKLYQDVQERINQLASENNIIATEALNGKDAELVKIDLLTEAIKEKERISAEHYRNELERQLSLLKGNAQITGKIEYLNKVLKLQSELSSLPSQMRYNVRAGKEMETNPQRQRVIQQIGDTLFQNPNLNFGEKSRLFEKLQINPNDFFREVKGMRDQINNEINNLELAIDKSLLGSLQQALGDPEDLEKEGKTVGDVLKEMRKELDAAAASEKYFGETFDELSEKIKIYQKAFEGISEIDDKNIGLKELSDLIKNLQLLKERIAERSIRPEDIFNPQTFDIERYDENRGVPLSVYEDIEKSRRMQADNVTESDFLNKQFKQEKALSNVIFGINSVGDALVSLGGTASMVGNLINTISQSMEKNRLIGGKIDWAGVGQDIMGTAMSGIISNLVSGIMNLTKRNTANKWEDTGFSTFEMMSNFKNFEENQKKLNELYQQKGLNTIGGTAIGAGIGAIFGPLGAAIGGLLGGWIGSIINNIDQQISTLEASLQATWADLKEMLGTSVESVANALGQAFQTENYMDFLTSWNQSLYEMTKQALIKAFLATEAFQDLYKGLSDTVTLAVLDGMLTSEEIAAIKLSGNEVASQMQVLYNALGLLDTAFAGVSGGNTNVGGDSQQATYTAGSATNLVINNYVNIYGTYFGDDPEGLRAFSLLVADEISREQSRA